jgi:hypothetical protein
LMPPVGGNSRSASLSQPDRAASTVPNGPQPDTLSAGLLAQLPGPQVVRPRNPVATTVPAGCFCAASASTVRTTAWWVASWPAASGVRSNGGATNAASDGRACLVTVGAYVMETVAIPARCRRSTSSKGWVAPSYWTAASSHPAPSGPSGWIAHASDQRLPGSSLTIAPASSSRPSVLLLFDCSWIDRNPGAGRSSTDSCTARPGRLRAPRPRRQRERHASPPDHPRYRWRQGGSRAPSAERHSSVRHEQRAAGPPRVHPADGRFSIMLR